MRTFQGAEVIVPNSTFVSGQVINWTLSESRRRVEIPVGVAYGTDPERVIEILIEIAGTHGEVLREPALAAVFQGFGESSLNFLLLFWADQDKHFRLLSDFQPRGAVSRMYRAFHEEDGTCQRALFVVDGSGIITWSYLSPIDVNPGADGIVGALSKLKSPDRLAAMTTGATPRASAEDGARS